MGPPGTPYEDAVFVFDLQLPPDFPQQPPAVHYISHAERINPNLYENGKVCLSLLGTWTGRESCELWNPASSTVLQARAPAATAATAVPRHCGPHQRGPCTSQPPCASQSPPPPPPPPRGRCWSRSRRSCCVRCPTSMRRGERRRAKPRNPPQPSHLPPHPLRPKPAPASSSPCPLLAPHHAPRPPRRTQLREAAGHLRGGAPRAAVQRGRDAPLAQVGHEHAARALAALCGAHRAALPRREEAHRRPLLQAARAQGRRRRQRAHPRRGRRGCRCGRRERGWRGEQGGGGRGGGRGRVGRRAQHDALARLPALAATRAACARARARRGGRRRRDRRGRRAGLASGPRGARRTFAVPALLHVGRARVGQTIGGVCAIPGPFTVGGEERG
eukprot:scaffold32022_cov62-Phaeocystis_antarctica.AAC.1